MTTESFVPSPRYTISGTGPYAITHAFSDVNDIEVLVDDDGDLITLASGSYTIAPTEYAEDGDLTLTVGAAATYAGAELILHRATRIEQGWVGSQSAREKGLERQLDRMAQHAQDIGELIRRAPLIPLTETERDLSIMPPIAGRVIVGNADGTGWETGPSATEVATANAVGATTGGYWITDAISLLSDTTFAYAAAEGKVALSPGAIVQSRKEGFAYRTAAGIAIDHHVTNGDGVKFYAIYTHGLDPRQLGAPADGVGDDAPYVEAAFAISKKVKLGTDCTWRFASVIGIPTNGLYDPHSYDLVAFGAQIVLDGVAAGDSIFTSVLAKASPESTSDLYTGKVNFIGGNYTQSSASTLINGDRVYNVAVQIASFDGVTSVIKSYRSKGVGSENGYMQSVFLACCHFSQVAKIVDAKRAYNFRWDHCFAENCSAGIYIDGPDNAALVGFSMIGGLFEGGGLAVRLGQVLGGKVDGVYFEANTIVDAATDKCDIYIGYGGYRSSAFVVSNCFFGSTTSQNSDTNYVSIRDGAAPSGDNALVVRDCYSRGTRMFQSGSVYEAVGNTSFSSLLTVRSKAPRTPASARKTFRAGRQTRLAATHNAAGVFAVAEISVFDAKSYVGASTDARNAGGSIVLTMSHKTAGGYQNGLTVACIDFAAMGASSGGAVGGDQVNDVYMGFTLRSVVNVPAGLPIETTYSNNTVAHFTTPTLTATRSGDVYTLHLSGYSAGAAMTNYGAITQIETAITMEICAMNGSNAELTSLLRPN